MRSSAVIPVAGFVLAAGAMLSAGASAATMTLAGGYLLQYTSNCQAILNEVPATGSGAQTNSVSQGHIEEEIGTITFTPSTPGATSGKVSLSLQTAAGDSVALQHGGVGATGVAAGSFSASGTYSTAGSVTTLTLGPNSQASFQTVLGAPKAGVAQSAVILKQPASGDTCIESAVLMHD
jgi:hypothetical protein